MSRSCPHTRAGAAHWGSERNTSPIATAVSSSAAARARVSVGMLCAPGWCAYTRSSGFANVAASTTLSSPGLRFIRRKCRDATVYAHVDPLAGCLAAEHPHVDQSRARLTDGRDHLGSRCQHFFFAGRVGREGHEFKGNSHGGSPMRRWTREFVRLRRDTTDAECDGRSEENVDWPSMNGHVPAAHVRDLRVGRAVVLHQLDQGAECGLGVDEGDGGPA